MDIIPGGSGELVAPARGIRPGCPECGEILQHVDGCVRCAECGYSTCG